MVSKKSATHTGNVNWGKLTRTSPGATAGCGQAAAMLARHGASNACRCCISRSGPWPAPLWSYRGCARWPHPATSAPPPRWRSPHRASARSASGSSPAARRTAAQVAARRYLAVQHGCGVTSGWAAPCRPRRYCSNGASFVGRATLRSYFGTASKVRCRRTVFTAQPTPAAICRRLNPCFFSSWISTYTSLGFKAARQSDHLLKLVYQFSIAACVSL